MIYSFGTMVHFLSSSGNLRKFSLNDRSRRYPYGKLLNDRSRRYPYGKLLLESELYCHQRCPCGKRLLESELYCHQWCPCGKLLLQSELYCHHLCPCGKLLLASEPYCVGHIRLTQAYNIRIQLVDHGIINIILIYILNNFFTIN